MAGEPLWVDGDKCGDFTYVGDVVRGIAAAIGRRERCRRAYNVATGTATPVADLARLVVEVTGSPSPIVVRAEGAAGRHLVADISRARKELGYAPQVGLRAGLAATYDWLASSRARATEGAADEGAAGR
jgi:nucleoside-diphosphate-sugar epimerase